MNSIDEKIYKDMLPEVTKPGRLGYYPVTNFSEWEELSDLYKTMEWQAVTDPRDRNNKSAVKAVIFDVPFMEPYGIGAKVSVHPSDVHKILFCSFKDAQCHLYSISAVELENGRKLRAEWLQDSISGAFCIKAGGEWIARQGGFQGFVPEHIHRREDGTFKFDFRYGEGKTTYYALGNPFRNEKVNSKGSPTLDSMVSEAQNRSVRSDSDNDYINRVPEPEQ